MTGKRRPSKGMSCPLPRTFALLGLCVFWGCAWLVMQWKTLQFSPARPPSPDAEDVPGPVPEKAVKPPKSIKTNPSRGHPSRGHQVHPGAHKSQVASCPQRPRRKEKWGEVVKEDMKIIKSSATAVQSCHRLGDALVYELRFLEAHKKEGFAYELLLPDYVVADEAGAGLERRSTLQLLAATGKGLQPLGPAHSSQEQVAKGDGSFGHWREPMERGFEHTASRLRFSTPGNVPLKELTRLVAVVFPMVPAMGFVEVVHKPDKKAKDYDPTKRRRRKELHRELFFEAFPRVGAQPHLADRPEETKPGVSYLWRTSHHDEFHLELKPNEVYEKRMPYAFAEYFGSFEHSGAVLFPPPPTYQYYENKVALTHLFQKSNVLMPETWVFSSLADAMAHRDQVRLPVVLKDPYGYSSIGLLQAETIGELMEAFNTFFAKAKVGVEVLVQRKVKALKEARVTYVDGRPFHGYWRIRQSLKSASAASTRGGFQDFNFPLEPLSDFVASFAQRTGIPVGGVDLIWKDSPDVQAEPYTLEVSPTSDINPPSPPDWKEGYAEFKHTKGFRHAYLGIRRKWAEAMTLAVAWHRRSKGHLFVGLDALLENGQVVDGVVDALSEIQRSFFLRLLAVPENQDPLNTTLGLLHSLAIPFDEVILLRDVNHRIWHLGPDTLLLDRLEASEERRLQELKLPCLNLADLTWSQVPQLALAAFKRTSRSRQPPRRPTSSEGEAPTLKPAPGPAKPPVAPMQEPRNAKRMCPLPAVGRDNWRQVPAKDLDVIREKWEASVKSCERRGEALVFFLNLAKANKVAGHAYEMPFPHYIVADEIGWRPKRSTLQLFTVDSSGHFHPLGPAHSAHSFIAEHGDGAYSHWRPGITNSTYGKAMLLFSTPRNVAIKKLSLAAVVYPMLPPMGWIEFNQGKKVNHEELFREMFLQSFAAAGVSRPHLIEQADEAIPGTRYLWRVGGNSEFQLPLADGELYEKRLPYQIAEWYAEFERKGGILYPPPHTYIYYQNKVGLARLFNERKVKIPPTWVFESLSEAEAELENIKFPVVIKDPYGFSSMHLLQAADKEEFLQNCQLYFEKALPGVEAIVQSKVVAMREARVTYIEGRPFHGYWRIRQSLKSASAASNLGGYQDFDFPLSEIAPYVAEFANLTGIPVGGVDFIWEEEKANVTVVPYTLEVSPTSDINPPAPTSWTKTYSEFKHTKGYRRAYLDVRRSWTDLMTLAVIDKYRQERKNLFVDIDNVVAKSMERVRRWKGSKKAYLASEVMQDEVVEGAVEALRRLQARYFIRFLTARGSYEDPFNVTQTWLDSKGFEYDELIVVHGPESKVAHLTSETILVDDFTTSHEKEEPATNQKFMDQLSAAGLPFVKFPLGGRWDDIMEKLLPSG
ncbi:unnamed protein product [Effrenium voratum]|uniref:ATP-grasp domain-containing protein n=1 Tax=Effrenium voratum TaxID=2562239 RepID=A0AA36N806_9DINO|nr:unnamed protein product [Effrenium voratum]